MRELTNEEIVQKIRNDYCSKEEKIKIKRRNRFIKRLKRWYPGDLVDSLAIGNTDAKHKYTINIPTIQNSITAYNYWTYIEFWKNTIDYRNLLELIAKN